MRPRRRTGTRCSIAWPCGRPRHPPDRDHHALRRRRRVDEDAFVALLHHLPRTAPTASSSPAPRARPRRSTTTSICALSSSPSREQPRGQDDRSPAPGSNDTRHAVELTERATELGVDAIAVGHAVLQPPQPPRARRALRGGRAGDRQAGPALQHPAAARARHAQRAARRARADRPHRRRQAGQRRQPRADRRPRPLRRQRRRPRPHARPGRRRRHPRRQPRRRRRDAPHRRRARSSARRSTPRCATSTTALAGTTRSRSRRRCDLLGPSASARLRLPLVEADEAERTAICARRSSAHGPADGRASAERPTLRVLRSAGWARSART